MGLNVRKLAALDLLFLGPGIILTEFALGVVGPLALGILTVRAAMRHGWPTWQIVFGAYLFSLGINYIPLLVHAIQLVRTGGASAEVAAEVAAEPGGRRATLRKYRRHSLYLLVPLAVPIFALMQRSPDRQ